MPQEIAVIQAMASEAYIEANNQIKKIEELQAEIGKNGAKNDLKRMAESTSTNSSSTGFLCERAKQAICSCHVATIAT